MAYIYKITNKTNNKAYIGKTDFADPEKRFKQHITDSRKDRNKNRPLYRAINKHGIDNFIFEILEQTDLPSDREIYYIKELKTYGSCGYNATLGGEGKRVLLFKEEDVVLKYSELKSCEGTAIYFECNEDTISNILKKNNIEVIEGSKVNGLKSSIKVCCIKNNELIKNFNSMIEAAGWLQDNGHTTNKSKTGIASHIKQAASGTRNTANGFVWKYI